MKLLATCIIVMMITLSGFRVTAQSKEVVSWEFSMKNISDKLYELHLTAKVKSPWHIYSQFSPQEGALPTAISFSRNPLITLAGKPKEKGAMREKYEKVFDVKVKYFEDSVDFIQMIQLKAKARTSISGTIEFMACNDEQCLPPDRVPFSLNIF